METPAPRSARVTRPVGPGSSQSLFIRKRRWKIASAPREPVPTLARRLGFGALALIGIGDILGAGIYALVGKVVGLAGAGAWISFLISAVLAAATGLSYAELASRVPRSAGAAAYAGAAFAHPIIPFLVGFLVLASGLTSTATVALAFRGYLQTFFPVSELAAAIGLIMILALITFRGIGTSAWTNNILTVIEALGLLVIIGVGLLIAAQADSAELLNRLTPEPGLAPILSGATLAFYAFVGFEDLANLAEEVKNPERDLPRAILAAVAVTTVIYVLVIIVVLWTLPIPEAATSARPLLDVLYAGGMPLPAPVFAVLAIFAISNTGLANFVMVSRLLYGMAGQGLLPPALARVHAVRQTPSVAIIISAALAFLLVVTGGVRLLAQTTSLLLVIVFSVVHVSLIRIRSRSKAPPNAFRVPRLVPWAGLIVCGFLVAYFPLDAFVRAGIIVSVGGAVYGLYGKWR